VLFVFARKYWQPEGRNYDWKTFQSYQNFEKKSKGNLELKIETTGITCQANMDTFINGFHIKLHQYGDKKTFRLI